MGDPKQLRQKQELQYGPSGPDGDYGFYPTSNAGPPKPRGPRKEWPYRSYLNDRNRVKLETRAFLYWRTEWYNRPSKGQMRLPYKSKPKWRKRRGGI